MENENWFWISEYTFPVWCIFFVVSLAVFIFGLYVFLFKKNNKNRIEIAALSEFIAYWLLYIPFQFCREFDGSHFLLHSAHSVVIAFLQTFTKYLGDGYDAIYYEGRPIFTLVYSGLYACVNILMLLFMAGFIIKFIDGPVRRFKLLTGKNKHLYLFSEYNYKTESIAKTVPDKKNCNIVFAGSEEELSEEEKRKIDQLGATVIYDELNSIIKKYKSYASGIEVFLFNKKEAENLTLLGSIAEEMAGTDVPSEIYVEIIKTPCDVYNDYLENYDDSTNSLDTKTVINFVRVEETYVYNDLLHNSIFNNFEVNESGEKEIKILIVGVNDRNIEFFKAVLFLSQMPGYKPTIVVIDNKDRPEYINTIIPELKAESNVKGDAIYKYVYCGGIALDSLKFEELIKNNLDFTFAYINAGNDLMNINAALKLNSICRRNNRDNGYKIQVSVSDAAICAQWDKKMLDSIKPTGEISEVYSYSFIAMSDIESLSKQIHIVRQAEKIAGVKSKAAAAQEEAQKALEKYESIKNQKKVKEKDLEAAKTEAEAAAEKAKKAQEKADKAKETPWQDYYNNEYNRHSVYARTLSFRHKVRLILEQGLKPSVSGEIDPWLIYEHMRWDMYTRTLGYVRADEQLTEELKELTKQIKNASDEEEVRKLKKQRQLVRSRAKVHEDLVLFEELPPDVRKQDGLKLTDEIVEAFEKVPLE